MCTIHTILPIPTVSELNGLTRLTFSLPGDVVISKNTIQQINTLPCLLSVEVFEKMAESDIVYSVGDLISLPKYLRQSKTSLDAAIKVLRDICDIVEKTKESALYAENLSFSPDHIFISTQSTELKMMLFPFETSQHTATALRTLLSVLTTEIMKTDSDADIKKITEYCNRSDFKLTTFSGLLDELAKNNKPARRKKEKRQKDGCSFWGKLLRKKEKITEQPKKSVDIDFVGSSTIQRKRNGTELLLQDDEPSVITAPNDPDVIVQPNDKLVRLTISINGMQSEADINSFPCTLGRSPKDANLILQDSGVSRRHAVIDFEDGGFVIYDLGSANGLTLNDAMLAPKSKHHIVTGDCITIGRVRLQVTKIGGV